MKRDRCLEMTNKKSLTMSSFYKRKNKEDEYNLRI